MSKSVSPMRFYEVGEKQIYFDAVHTIWRVREVQQHEPGNARSRKRWVDVDIHRDRSVLERRHPAAKVIGAGE